jgi:hypothetical protein
LQALSWRGVFRIFHDASQQPLFLLSMTISYAILCNGCANGGYFFSPLPLTAQLLVSEHEEKTGMPNLASTLQVQLQ